MKSRTISREFLVREGVSFYRRHLKGTRLGQLLGRQVLRYGLVKADELRNLAIWDMPLDVVSSDDLGRVETEFSPPGFHLSAPLNFSISDKLTTRPAINVILPSLNRAHMSGGPNTALILAGLLAERGERIRLIACDSAFEGDGAALFGHMDQLLRRPVRRDLIEFIDGFDRKKPVVIGPEDIFLATAWWTAQIAKYAVARTIHRTLIYLIQDFEPILHEGSTFHARALETYDFDHIPIVNTRLLLDYLIDQRAGRFADDAFARDALWFEPALDRKFYYPERTSENGGSKKKVLLFYARPSVARRNLFELGVVALQRAVAAGHINANNWELWAMGEKLPPVNLGNGVVLNPLPWMSFSDYARQMRTADLLLSLMLSPHPSYPPLEMAAAGKLVVTNSFSVKSPERMRSLSRNILVAEPNVDSIASVLGAAIGRINVGLPSPDPSGNIALPLDWDQSLNGVLEELLVRISGLRKLSVQGSRPLVAGLPACPVTDYERHRSTALNRRRREGEYLQQPGLLSFVTTVYDTPAVYLDELASSVFLQDGGMQFEWFILDNGSTQSETKQKLAELSRHPGVRLERVETNLGIVGGMRLCLERASGQYIMPLDSDDLLDRDCVNVVTRFLKEANYPAAVYTDEDKFDGANFGQVYFKPDWDPVLFLHSCYIAHLCVINRKLALELGFYTDKNAEGCHDWDSFIRLMNADHVPHHLPEALYTWRMHQQSTSANIGSKSYISESHAATLQRALAARSAPHLQLVSSPLFHYNVDWWYRRDRNAPVSCATVRVVEASSAAADPQTELQVVADRGDALQQLSRHVAALSSDLVHVIWNGVIPNDDEWRWDSAGLLEMFPDAVMVGGTLHNGERIIDGPRIFGFGNGCDCPDSGRPLTDPGYSAIAWKAHSVSAVASAHFVVKREFLLKAMPALLAEEMPLGMIGSWLGGLAAESGARVIFSPFMAAKVDVVPESRAPAAARSRFLSRFWSLMPDTRYYSRHLGLTRETAYTPVAPEARDRHLQQLQLQTQPYARWLESETRLRGLRYPMPTNPATIAIVTPVYRGSNLELLDELARSIARQTLPVAQWLLIVNGTMPEDMLQHIRAKADGEWKAALIVAPKIAGIVAALRVGVESAQADYVVPVDGDDLITDDAVQILAHEIDRNGRPDFLFSDEDILVDGKPRFPFLRAAYDPVLSLENSAIWHLCAMKREVALKADVYSDATANWTQDWDVVSRMAAAKARMQHVPEVLYHWRQHAGSTTNNAEGDARSLDSVRHVLERHIAQSPRPELFEVADWPEFRGAPELYIARRRHDLPEFVWIGDLAIDGRQVCRDDSILLCAGNGVMIENQDDVLLEATRLFDLHPGVGAVGGNVVNRDKLIVDGCYMRNPAGKLESPWLGRAASDGGPFALAAKPQSVALPGGALAFFRIAALKQVGLLPLNKDWSRESIVWRLCDGLAAHGWTVAFSPLIRAKVEIQGWRGPVPRASWPMWSATSAGLVRYGTSRNFIFE
ncbi:glycosyltransferase [Bradyrhizobium sp. Ai1a-2]|uniref:rhamnosyltransferase WsaF family glycosyltransferase n=1 Tax=Bradyrhizobium sp. Ai1a-2 TaxID=196490 RepID=UPI0004224081|nr:glycosyltransferase [Bradyrhizobium sp. Ai1a-2]